MPERLAHPGALRKLGHCAVHAYLYCIAVPLTDRRSDGSTQRDSGAVSVELGSASSVPLLNPTGVRGGRQVAVVVTRTWKGLPLPEEVMLMRAPCAAENLNWSRCTRVLV